MRKNEREGEDGLTKRDKASRVEAMMALLWALTIIPRLLSCT